MEGLKAIAVRAAHELIRLKNKCHDESASLSYSRAESFSFVDQDVHVCRLNEMNSKRENIHVCGIRTQRDEPTCSGYSKCVIPAKKRRTEQGDPTLLEF